jgi:hypothetical protein
MAAPIIRAIHEDSTFSFNARTMPIRANIRACEGTKGRRWSETFRSFPRRFFELCFRSRQHRSRGPPRQPLCPETLVVFRKCLLSGLVLSDRLFSLDLAECLTRLPLGFADRFTFNFAWSPHHFRFWLPARVLFWRCVRLTVEHFTRTFFGAVGTGEPNRTAHRCSNRL